MARKPTTKQKIKRFVREYPSIPLFVVSFILGGLLLLFAQAGQQ